MDTSHNEQNRFTVGEQSIYTISGRKQGGTKSLHMDLFDDSVGDVASRSRA